jgi:uncharacterized protein YndB with AHSA1/START domain
MANGVGEAAAGQAATGVTVRVARVIPAPPEAAYGAWSDVTRKLAWWGRTEKGKLIECLMDLRIGGGFRYAMAVPQKPEADVVEGRFLEISPPNRQVFTWSDPAPGGANGETTVTVEFVNLRDGSCRAVVTHEGLPGRPAAAVHQAGWSDMLQDLAMHFSGQEG